MKLIVLAILALGPALCFATPDPFENKVETLLGEADGAYCVLEYSNVNKGSHYEYEEIFYLVWKSIDTGSETKRTVVKRQAVSLDDGRKRVKAIEKGSDIVLARDRYEPVAAAFPFWEALSIEDGRIVVDDRYGDDPGKYRVRIDLPSSFGKARELAYVSLMESEDAYYFALRVTWNDVREETVYFALRKQAYYDLIPPLE